ncbi:ATP-binding protein [Mucilaginibacter terrae]|uniref:sensor histidine kinase n=1 Tax=Mucilaginibacter terrae TaxID=1955052 RepID=UPI003643432F
MNEEVKKLRLQNMVEEIEDYAILLLDSSGNIENWNKGAEKIKGYKAEEILGKNFSLFYTPEDQKSKKPEMLIYLARVKGYAFDEGWRIRRDGSRFWGSIAITAIHDEQQNVIGFTKVTRDLTDKMLAAEAVSQHMDQLQIKNQELEQFVYIASHDLQEPLLTVSNFISLLKAEYGHLYDDDATMYMGFVEQAADRMRTLIKDLLDYSRIGKVKLAEQVDVNELLLNITSDLDTLISQTGAKLIYSGLPTVKAYRTELRQLFQNLITNAVKFAKKDVAPVINITAKPYNDGWQFSVQDNGIGIADKYKEKIFLIFQRLHNRDDYPGNGIGLANCKKIAIMHNGDIDVRSVFGEGSEFYFNLEL